MAGETHSERDQHQTGDLAADSTHFRSRDTVLLEEVAAGPKRHSDSFYPSPKSMRLTPRSHRGGLALKIAIPIVLALVATSIFSVLLVRNHVSKMQREDIQNDAANSAFTAGVLGRVLLSLQADFHRENPEYLTENEWLTGRHWLVTQHLVSEQEWVEATGFDLNEYAPIETLEMASENLILQDITGWLNTGSELVALFLFDGENRLFAGASANNFRFDSITMRAIPTPADQDVAAGIRVVVDYIDELGPEPIIRGVARIMSRNDTSVRIGTAVVVLRTGIYTDRLHSLIYLMLGTALLVIVAMAVIAWYSAGRVTGPIRRLAADMQAMAEGDYTRRSNLPDTDEIGLLAQAFNSMAERLRVARANKKENSRLESDLAIARSIQNNLLPLQTPRVRGLDIHTSYRPAREIGGDYFDFLPVDNEHMGIAIADASGKSIPAALVMSTTRAILRFVAPGNNSAAETLTRVNAILSVDIPKGMFVTAYYLILDPLNNQMLCASAGHTPLLIARSDGSVELLNPGGIALGFDNGPIFQRSIREQRVKLEKGDRVLLYTDGVVECVNPANEEYSDRRLREFLRRNRELSSYEFVGALLADLDRHRGTAEMRDDTTIVTFKVL